MTADNSNSNCNNLISTLSTVTNLDDYIFDPLDGTFVRINFNNDAECSGTLSEQGRRDSWALVVTLGFLSLLLLVLLYISCN
jgi:hypothetical protein